MAGKPGMKGGGGARVGAGRKKSLVSVANSAAPTKIAQAAPQVAEARPVVEGKDDPLNYLLGVVADQTEDPKLRVRAAIAAAQYLHTKRADGGIKDGRQEAAKKAGAGRFAPAAPPKLVVNNR